MRGSGRGRDVVPLGQSVGVPNAELLSCRDFSQHAVENLQTERKKKKKKMCVEGEREAGVNSSVQEGGAKINLTPA